MWRWFAIAANFCVQNSLNNPTCYVIIKYVIATCLLMSIKQKTLAFKLAFNLTAEISPPNSHIHLEFHYGNSKTQVARTEHNNLSETLVMISTWAHWSRQHVATRQEPSIGCTKWWFFMCLLIWKICFRDACIFHHVCHMAWRELRSSLMMWIFFKE